MIDMLRPTFIIRYTNKDKLVEVSSLDAKDTLDTMNTRDTMVTMVTISKCVLGIFN